MNDKHSNDRRELTEGELNAVSGGILMPIPPIILLPPSFPYPFPCPPPPPPKQPVGVRFR